MTNRLLKQQMRRTIFVVPSTESVRKTGFRIARRLKQLGYQVMVSENGSTPVIGTSATVVILDCMNSNSLHNPFLTLHDTPILLVRNATRKIERWMIRGIVNQNCNDRELKRAMNETLLLKTYPSVVL